MVWNIARLIIIIIIIIPYKLQHYRDRSEYWEESWRVEETYCHSDSSERLSAYAGVENLHNIANKYRDHRYVVGALGTVTKNLEKRLSEPEIRGRIETIQTTALLNRLGYLEESRASEGTWSHLNSSERPSVRLLYHQTTGYLTHSSITFQDQTDIQYNQHTHQR